MAYQMHVEGLKEQLKMIEQLGEEGKIAASRALYEGARVVADAVDQAVHGIATEPFKYAKGGRKRKPSPEEKAIITDAAHGVAKFRKRLDRVDTKVGWNGATDYANVNFSHMSTSARTNYKAVAFKGHGSNASSFLRAIRKASGSNIGKGAQNQKPVGVIANAINSGTSFMQKQPFARKAFSQSKAAAIAAIENKLSEELNKLGD